MGKKRRRRKNCVASDQKVLSEGLEAKLALELLSLRETTDPCPSGSIVGTWTDEDLFRKPPTQDECSICFILLSRSSGDTVYQPCCGQLMCTGCLYTFDQRSFGCPFCRAPKPWTEREVMERLMKRGKVCDPEAMALLGCFYRFGARGLPQDLQMAMKLYSCAGELKNADSYGRLGDMHRNGEGVEANIETANHYYTLAAMGGSVTDRYKLGTAELMKGDVDRAVKHWMISAGCGDDNSLASIREWYEKGRASKEDFGNALRAFGEAKAETKSEQREAAAKDPQFALSHRLLMQQLSKKTPVVEHQVTIVTFKKRTAEGGDGNGDDNIRQERTFTLGLTTVKGRAWMCSTDSTVFFNK